MRTQRSRIAIISVVLVGLIIFTFVYYSWNTATDIFQPVSPPGQGKTIPIKIEKDETTAQIADDLQSKGLIRNALAFRVWARIKGLDTQLQAGGYNHLNSSMTISDIVDQLLNAQPDVIFVTIPEGWRIEQIADRFASQGLTKFKKQEFLNYVKHPETFPNAAKYPVLKEIPKGDSMEGLLFPATYDTPVDATALDVVTRMLDTYEFYVKQNNLVAKAQANHLTEYQMVILASLVQREITNNRDDAGVAGVYWNRFMNQVPNDTAGYMGSDPSVEYARDTDNPPAHYWQPLQDGGKNIDPNSPWNTYTHTGFPPTPICSPGLATLLAAASPTKSDNFYFLSKPNGDIVYAKTYADFQVLVQKYIPPQK